MRKGEAMPGEAKFTARDHVALNEYSQGDRLPCVLLYFDLDC